LRRLEEPATAFGRASIDSQHSDADHCRNTSRRHTSDRER
jgi:hypothetical protein